MQRAELLGHFSEVDHCKTLRWGSFLKSETPSQAVFCPRRRLIVWCTNLCAGGEPGAMPTPFSISVFPVRGYNIAEDVVGVNTLTQSPLFVAGKPSSHWKDFNYKSSRARLLVVIFTGDCVCSPKSGQTRPLTLLSGLQSG